MLRWRCPKSVLLPSLTWRPASGHRLLASLDRSSRSVGHRQAAALILPCRLSARLPFPITFSRLRSDFNNHVLQPRRVAIQDLAPIFPDDHGIGMAKPAEMGIVHAWLAREGHPLAQHRLIAFGDPG